MLLNTHTKCYLSEIVFILQNLVKNYIVQLSTDLFRLYKSSFSELFYHYFVTEARAIDLFAVTRPPYLNRYTFTRYMGVIMTLLTVKNLSG